MTTAVRSVAARAVAVSILIPVGVKRCEVYMIVQNSLFHLIPVDGGGGGDAVKWKVLVLPAACRMQTGPIGPHLQTAFWWSLVRQVFDTDANGVFENVRRRRTVRT